ncbi:MAG: sigma-70 family RNA polymerase sigma factor [Williamsia sp.]|nr:sigma-70 family RNA polymerase sigma factor [Williamsia sp.]
MSKLLQTTEETFLYYTRYTEGDSAALGWIYKEVHRPFTRLASRWLEDSFAVQTCLQETVLKGWQFRHRMNGPAHLYRFMRLSLRWICLGYLRQPSHRFHRGLLPLAQPDWIADREEEPTHHFDEERYRLVEKALPYLSGTKGTILTLYFKHGISYKSIAKRWGSPYQTVHTEAQRGVRQLRSIILSHKGGTASAGEPPAVPLSTGGMDKEMEQVFRYRYEMKLGFAQIALKMNLPQPYVQQQYISAHRYLRTLQRK